MTGQQNLNGRLGLDSNSSEFKDRYVAYARSSQVLNAWPLFIGARDTPQLTGNGPEDPGTPQVASAATLAGARVCHVKPAG